MFFSPSPTNLKIACMAGTPLKTKSGIFDMLHIITWNIKWQNLLHYIKIMWAINMFTDSDTITNTDAAFALTNIWHKTETPVSSETKPTENTAYMHWT